MIDESFMPDQRFRWLQELVLCSTPFASGSRRRPFTFEASDMMGGWPVSTPPLLAGPGFNILASTIQDIYVRHPTYTWTLYT
jgi:hypothetical protein